MKVWEESAKLNLPKDPNRSEGWHLTDITRDLAFQSATLDKKWWSEITLDDQDTTLMQVGMAMENYIGETNQHPGLEYHPGELVAHMDVCEVCGKSKADHQGFYEDDGHVYQRLVIYLSPDGISRVGDVAVIRLVFLHEFKATKKSSRDFGMLLRQESRKVKLWLWQIKAYCRALRTLAAKLHVVFLCGNYSYDANDPEATTTYKVFRIEFTQDELDANWLMLTEHARYMIQHGKYRPTESQ